MDYRSNGIPAGCLSAWLSVLTHLRSDILLVDEVLAVGDQGFREKCLQKMEDEVALGRTIIFVSHDIPAMERFTQRCLHIHQAI